MTIPQIKTHIGFLLIVLLFSSCVSPEESVEDSNTLRPKVNSNVNVNMSNVNVDANINVAEDDLGKLKDLINLPFEPEFNNYRLESISEDVNKSPVPESVGQKMTVILKFSSDDKEKLIDQIKGKKPPFEVKTEAENWFPAELVAKSNAAADKSLKGEGYSAEKFVKSPFNIGSLIHIKDTDYFVLILKTN